MEYKNDHPLIDCDPMCSFGKPKIKGTRIAVIHALEIIASYTNPEEMLDDHPAMTREVREAVLFYASENIAVTFEQREARLFGALMPNKPLSERILTKGELYKQWDNMCHDEQYGPIQGRNETNEYGQLIVTPSEPNIHSDYQFKIMSSIKGLPAIPILTKRGVKVADVAWFEPGLWQTMKNDACCRTCPTICIEVWGPHNGFDAQDEKIRLYLEEGAQEVWTCDNGTMEFFNKNEELEKSAIFPDFPKVIEL